MFLPNGWEAGKPTTARDGVQFVFYRKHCCRQTSRKVSAGLVPTVPSRWKVTLRYPTTKSLPRTVSRILKENSLMQVRPVFAPISLRCPISKEKPLNWISKFSLVTRKEISPAWAATPSDSHAERVKAMDWRTPASMARTRCQVSQQQLVEKILLPQRGNIGPLLPVVSYNRARINGYSGSLDSPLASLFSDDDEFNAG